MDLRVHWQVYIQKTQGCDSCTLLGLDSYTKKKSVGCLHGYWSEQAREKVYRRELNEFKRRKTKCEKQIKGYMCVPPQIQA